MRYRIICVGKVRESYIAQAVDDFRNRLRRYDGLEEVEIAVSRAADAAGAMRDEADRILRLIDAGDAVWLLERLGTALSSEAIAQRVASLEVAGRPQLTIVIAGTFGAAQALKDRADMLWSLGPLTFLHEWARAIVLEQLYRAAKINRNEPYHH
jgi:23S rRNA (pseudouridine1915-N3)-methyltransferase